jgi:hypothetical protein
MHIVIVRSHKAFKINKLKTVNTLWVSQQDYRYM